MDEDKVRKYVEEPIEKAIEIYIQNRELRNSICQIPIIGIVLDEIMTGIGRDFQK